MYMSTHVKQRKGERDVICADSSHLGRNSVQLLLSVEAIGPNGFAGSGKAEFRSKGNCSFDVKANRHEQTNQWKSVASRGQW